MRIGWVILCEGLAQDADGAFSLIRVNRNVLFASTFPLQLKRSVLVHLEAEKGEDLTALTPVTFSHSVKGPDGGIIAAGTGHGNFAPLPFPDLPGGVDVPIEFVIQLDSLGEYSIEISARFANKSSDSGTVSLFAVDPNRAIDTSGAASALVEPSL